MKQKTILYYFTGSGNSYYAARTFAEQYGTATMKPISSFFTEKKSHKEDIVGIFFPVHMASAPRVVQQFARYIEATYFFSFATCGFGKGISHMQIDKKYQMRNKKHTDAFFTVKMPHAAAKQTEELLRSADTYIKTAAAMIKSKKRYGNKGFVAFYYLLNPIISFFMKKIGPKIASTYKVSDKCNGCGTCVKLCPVGNIAIKGGKAIKGDKCEFCMACFQWCPESAIVNDKDDKQNKYTNPRVKVDELIRG
jgi:ferredoxin